MRGTLGKRHREWIGLGGLKQEESASKSSTESIVRAIKVKGLCDVSGGMEFGAAAVKETIAAPPIQS